MVTRWPRERLLQELKRALEASLHPESEAMLKEIEDRLTPDGWRLEVGNDARFPPRVRLFTPGSYAEMGVPTYVNDDPRWQMLGWVSITATNRTVHYVRQNWKTCCGLRVFAHDYIVTAKPQGMKPCKQCLKHLTAALPESKLRAVLDAPEAFVCDDYAARENEPLCLHCGQTWQAHA